MNFNRNKKNSKNIVIVIFIHKTGTVGIDYISIYTFFLFSFYSLNYEGHSPKNNQLLNNF